MDFSVDPALEEHLALSVFAFNLGVEAGQLTFVAVVVVQRGPDYDRVVAEGHGIAEPVVFGPVAGRQLGLWGPHAGTAHVDVGRAREGPLGDDGRVAGVADLLAWEPGVMPAAKVPLVKGDAWPPVDSGQLAELAVPDSNLCIRLKTKSPIPVGRS